LLVTGAAFLIIGGGGGSGGIQEAGSKYCIVCCGVGPTPRDVVVANSGGLRKYIETSATVMFHTLYLLFECAVKNNK
jgi:hypothetical protein